VSLPSHYMLKPGRVSTNENKVYGKGRAALSPMSRCRRKLYILDEEQHQTIRGRVSRYMSLPS
jgi:hypothetical protein